MLASQVEDCATLEMIQAECKRLKRAHRRAIRYEHAWVAIHGAIAWGAGAGLAVLMIPAIPMWFAVGAAAVGGVRALRGTEGTTPHTQAVNEYRDLAKTAKRIRTFDSQTPGILRAKTKWVLEEKARLDAASPWCYWTGGG